MEQERRWQGLGAVVILAGVVLGWGLREAWAYPIPDSGQSKCYNDTAEITCPQPGEAFYGQDGNYPGNPRSYTKLDASGNDLPDTASSWALVRDNVTHLEWEAKTTDGTIHDTTKTFTWCDSNPATNGGNHGTCGNGTDTEDFIANLNQANFGGHHDWRLPTARELYSLPNRGTYWPAIDGAYFPHTQLSSYWSATTYASSTSYAWRVYFGNGGGNGINKSSSYYVRAVRSGQGLDHLADNGDGTVTATSTGLMWQQATAPATTWSEALAYTEGLDLADFSDWRLPTSEELTSLVDYSKPSPGPTIDQVAFPNTQSSSYWSATTDATYASSSGIAWLVNFYLGYGLSSYKSDSYYVRAVRSGQGLGPLAIAAPQPGATVGLGATVAMAWDPKGLGGQVALSLSRDGGKAWEVLSASTANDGAFAWQVTGPVSSNCLLRVEPAADPAQASYQGLFSIVNWGKIALLPTPTQKFTVYDLAVTESWSNGVTQALAPAELTWQVSGPATLSDGTLTATGKGLATVSASYQGLTASVTLLLANPAQPDDQEAEPNNEAASADVLPAGQVWKAEALADDTDLFALHLDQAALIRVGYVSTSATADVTLEVVDGLGQVVATASSVNGALQSISCGLLAGDHFLRLSPSGDVDQNGAYLIGWQVEQFIDIPASLVLALNGQVSATLYSLSDSRALTFNAEAGKPLTFTFTPSSPSAAYTLTLTNGAGQAVGAWSASGQPLVITTGLASGPHTLTVTQAAAVDAAHPFTVALAAASGTVEQEPNATASQATPLSMGGIAQAMLPAGDSDLFRLSLPQPTLVKLILTGSQQAAYRLTLLEPGGTAIDGTLSVSGAASLDVGLLAGDYLVRVETNGAVDQGALYTLALTTATTLGLEVEPNDTLEIANGLDTLVPRTGRIYSATDVDLFGYTLASKTSYAITFTPSPTVADYTVEVVNPAGTVLATKAASNGGAVTLNLTPKAAGTFYLRVRAAGGVDPYATYTVTMATTAEVTPLVKLAGLTATPGTSGLTVGGSTTIAVQAIYSDAQAVAKTAAEGVTFASSNLAVATVDGSGQVAGLTTGYATITVAYQGQAVAVNLTVGSPQSVVSQDRGNLIIVAGGTAGDALEPATQALSELAYQKFKARTFTDSDIYFLDHQAVHDLNGDGYDDQIVDDQTPTKDEVTAAITGWAKDQTSSGPLYLYLVDHGAKGGLFQVASGQVLTAPLLKVALDSFQLATGRPVVVIIEACYSGGFVEPLANPSYQRLVLSSVDAVSPAYLGATGTPSYSWFFLTGLYKGLSIGDSLSQAKADLALSGGGYNAMAPQVGGAEALQGLKVGGDFLLAGLFPVLSDLMPSQQVVAGSLGLSLQVQSLTGGLSVWAVIIPPDYVPPVVSADFETPVDALPKVTLQDEDPSTKALDGGYVGSYDGFTKNGPYTVIFYAKDSDNNLAKSAPVTITVSGGVAVVTTTTTAAPTTTTTSMTAATTTTTQAPGTTTTTTIPGIASVSLSVSQGWNLLSSAIGFEATAKLNDGGLYLSVWKWVNNSWAVYLPGGDTTTYAASKGFGNLSAIAAGEGFWVNSKVVGEVTISGSADSGVVSLGTGWNLVGLKGGQGKAVADLLAGQTKVISLWKWAGNSWSVYLPGETDQGAGYATGKGFTFLENIAPGEGFWVNSSGATMLP